MLAYALPKAAIGYLGDPDRYDQAMQLCDEGIELSRQIGDRPLIAPALNVRGELTRIAGRDDLARAAYEEGRDLSIAAGDDAHLSVFLANLRLHLRSTRATTTGPAGLACESLRLAWSQGRRLMSAWTVDKIAGAELWLGPPRTRRHAHRGLRQGARPARRRTPSGRHARARARGGGVARDRSARTATTSSTRRAPRSRSTRPWRWRCSEPDDRLNRTPQLWGGRPAVRVSSRRSHGYHPTVTVRRNIFVLSGGGNRGAGHVGMLRALSAAGITPDLLIGGSVGAINATFIGYLPDLVAASAALPAIFPPVVLHGPNGPSTHVDAGVAENVPLSAPSTSP